jgi:hypothetical protein
MENALVLKRKLKDTGFEIADSEDKYGWESDDARHLPPEPPQWQGSEDLIVGTQKYKRDSDGDSDDSGAGGGESEAEEGPDDTDTRKSERHLGGEV